MTDPNSTSDNEINAISKLGRWSGPTALDPMRAHLDEASVNELGILRIVGWAVCVAPFDEICVYLNDERLGIAERSIRRDDVEAAHADYPDSLFSGFVLQQRLADDVPAAARVHVVLIADGGIKQELTVSVVRSYTATKDENDGNQPMEQIRFHIDAPEVQSGYAVNPTRGFMLITGWAIAAAGVEAIEVLVDKMSVGIVSTQISRPDIVAAFPEWDSPTQGFKVWVPSQVLRPGVHDINVIVRDNVGRTKEIKFKTISEESLEGAGPWQLRRKIPQAEIEQKLTLLSQASYLPFHLVLIPLRSSDRKEIALLRETVESVLYQGYPNWSVLIALQGTLDAELLKELDTAASSISIDGLLKKIMGDLSISVEQRVRLAHVPEKQILAELLPADGMLTILTAGDRLGEDALLEFCIEALTQGFPDFLYSDERRISSSSGNGNAFFKPDWSPDFLLSTNYIGRLWSATTDLLRQSSLTLDEVVALGEYNTVLRLTEKARSIVHVQKVLCERIEGPVQHPEVELNALRNAALRRGIAAKVFPGYLAGTWRFKYDLQAPLRTKAMVSIIISTNASSGLIKIALDSILSKTSWPNYEIILVDIIGQTTNSELLAWKRWIAENVDQVIDMPPSADVSACNNAGAAQARGEYLLLLSDSLEVLAADWLDGLVEHAQREDVGIVGSRLIYPNGRIHHAGLFLSKSVGRHAFRFSKDIEPGAFGLAQVQRNVIGVSGECMMIRRTLLDKLGGFNEAIHGVASELDFALRAQQANLRVIYTPFVTLLKHGLAQENKTLESDQSIHNRSRWTGVFLTGDPFFHPRLEKSFDDYAVDCEPLEEMYVGYPLVKAENVRRILAVKVDHIGDFVTAFPAFRRIKQQFPSSELYVLGARDSLSVASCEPTIDHMIEFNFFKSRSRDGKLEIDESGLVDLQQKLVPMRFDLAMDLRRHPETRHILKYTGARWLAGFDQHYKFPWLDISHEFEGDQPGNLKRGHVTDALVHFVDNVARACGCDRKVLKSLQPPTPTTFDAPCPLPVFETTKWDLFKKPVICIHAGGAIDTKQWPVEYYAALIDLILEHEDVNILLIGGPEVREFEAYVLGNVRHVIRVFSLVDKVSLRDLPTVLQKCRLFVGNDSGPKHLAAALNVPTIGIHSASVDAGEWGPIGRMALALRRNMVCGPCFIASAADCPRNLACLTGISVGDVYRSCQRMLAFSRLG